MADLPIVPAARKDSAARRRMLWYAVIAAGYLLAAAPLVYLSRDAINPDGISYIQAARHYAAGRLGLAVNGWFGPMVSWLLVPACWAGMDPVLAFRVLIVLSGLVFAAGVVRLTARLGGERLAIVAFACALVLSLRTVFAELTPDFVQAAGLAWYFALSVDLLTPAPSRKTAVLAGLVAGACFLVKGYTLWFVLLHLGITLGIRALFIRRRGQAGWALVPFGLVAGAMLLVSAPWIAVISVQDGRLTTNTPATRAMKSWPSKGWPEGVPFYDTFPDFAIPGTRGYAPGWGQWNGLYPHFVLQQPREGRVTVWENPVEAGGTWPSWAPPGDPKALAKQVTVAFYNLGRSVEFIRNWDYALVLPIVGALAAIAALAWGPLREVRALWLWGFLSAAAYLAGYLLLFLYERFTWGVWAPLIATVVALMARLIWRKQDEVSRPPNRKQEKGSESRGSYPRHPGRPVGEGVNATGLAISLILIVATAGSVGYRLVERLCTEVTNPGSESAMGTWIRKAAGDSPLKGGGARIASNDWAKGLYFSYWSGSVFLGQYPSFRTPEESQAWQLDPGKGIRPYSPMNVLVFEFPSLANFLRQAPGFRSLRDERDPRSGWRLSEFHFAADGNR